MTDMASCSPIILYPILCLASFFDAMSVVKKLTKFHAAITNTTSAFKPSNLIFKSATWSITKFSVFNQGRPFRLCLRGKVATNFKFLRVQEFMYFTKNWFLFGIWPIEKKIYWFCYKNWEFYYHFYRFLTTLRSNLGRNLIGGAGGTKFCLGTPLFSMIPCSRTLKYLDSEICF